MYSNEHKIILLSIAVILIGVCSCIDSFCIIACSSQLSEVKSKLQDAQLSISRLEGRLYDLDVKKKEVSGNR